MLYDHYFESYKYLNINEIKILLINLCPIYRALGLKQHEKTQ